MTSFIKVFDCEMEWLFATVFVLLWSTSDAGSCNAVSSLVTYNAALAPKLSEYDTRRDLIPAAIGGVNADVICLQELWYEDDMKNILDKMSVQGFNSYSTIHDDINLLRAPVSFWNWIFGRSSNNAPCLQWKVVPFVACQTWHCRGLSDFKMLSCMEQNCRSHMDSIAQECLTCLAVGMKSLTTVIERCVSVFRTYNRFNTQALMLLSKKKILSASRQLYQNAAIQQILPRGYIEAEIEDIGTVICTHLTANISSMSIEYNLNFASPEEQQADEIKQLHDKYKNQQHIIMGDLNTGPVDATRDLWGDFPDNYDLIKNYGYTSPYEINTGNCTYCGFNTVQGYKYRDRLLDHILLTDQTYQDTKRILDSKISGTHLSDHFGVQVDLCTGDNR